MDTVCQSKGCIFRHLVVFLGEKSTLCTTLGCIFKAHTMDFAGIELHKSTRHTVQSRCSMASTKNQKLRISTRIYYLGCISTIMYECLSTIHILWDYWYCTVTFRRVSLPLRWQVFVLWLRYSKGIFGAEGTNEDQRITTSNVWYDRINLSISMIIYVLPWSSTDYSRND